jgi:acyl-CoA dehydrogenase
MHAGLATMAARFDEIFSNLPNRPMAWLLRFMLMPLGPRHRNVPDSYTTVCANLLLEPSAARDRLTAGIYRPTDDSGVARLNRAFRLAVAAQPLRDRVRKAHVGVAEARAQGLISEDEKAQLDALAKAIADVINVDDFAPEELAPGAHDERREARGDVPSPVHHAAE